MFDWNKVKFTNPVTTYSSLNEARLGPDLIIYQIIFETNNQLLSFDEMITLLADMHHEINEILKTAKKCNKSEYLVINSVEIVKENADFYLKVYTFPGCTAGALEKLQLYFSLPPIIINIPKIDKPKKIISEKDIGNFVPNQEKKMLTLLCDKDVNEYLKKVSKNRKLGLVLNYYPEQSLLTISPYVNEWTMGDLNAAATNLKLSSKDYNTQRRLLDWNTCTSSSASLAKKTEKLQQIGSKRKYKHSIFSGTSNKMPRNSATENQLIVDADFISSVRAKENSVTVVDNPVSKLEKSSNLDFSVQYNRVDEIENLEIQQFLNPAR